MEEKAAMTTKIPPLWSNNKSKVKQSRKLFGPSLCLAEASRLVKIRREWRLLARVASWDSF